MILEVKDLHFNYGGIRALVGVNLHVDEGEIVALIGANGAGKTTLLKTISGIFHPTQGSILYNQKNIHTISSDQIVRQGLVHVPEGRLIFANLTVKENLELGAFGRKKIKWQEEFEQVFILFPRLKERHSQQAGTLSGGEQQMLAIGRALMAKPRMILLDEPSLGIAPQLVKQIFSKIEEINRLTKTTIFIVEQDAKLALKLSHRAYVMETGNIVFSGLSQDLLQDKRVQQAYLGEG